MTKRNEAQKAYDALQDIEALSKLDDRFLDIAEPIVAIAGIADAEQLNGSRRIWPELQQILLIMGGQRAEVEQNTAIGAVVELLKNELGKDEDVFLPNAYLLSKVQETDGLKWIRSKKALATFLGKLDLVASHLEAQRGYRVEKQWLDELENRYVPL
jgi:hypothetical protein